MFSHSILGGLSFQHSFHYPEHTGAVLGAGERDRVAEQRGSMSSSRLDWERECGASGEGIQGKRDAGGEGAWGM